MKTVIIDQARMGSTRLPGKILKEVEGRALLSYQIERLRRVKNADLLVIATTTAPQDDRIVEFCRQENVECFRGSEDDVLERYYLAAKKFDAETIVRVTSDCPLIDPGTIENLIEKFLSQRSGFDYVSNTTERTFPRGMDAEVFSFAALEKAYEKAKGTDREHVTPYIYRTPEEFKIFSVRHEPNEGAHRWTVDTAEDFELVSLLLKAALKVRTDFNLHDLLRIIGENPAWSKINAHINQKPH